MKIPILVLMPADAGMGNQLFILNAARFLEVQFGRPTVVAYHRPKRTLSYGDARLLISNEVSTSCNQVLSTVALFALKTFRLLRKAEIFENLVHDGRRHEVKSVIAKRSVVVVFDYFQELTSDSYLDFEAIPNLDSEQTSLDSKKIAIHCRRGDYLGNPDYGIVPLETQVQAALKLLGDVQRPEGILVFSDSKKAVGEELERLVSLQPQIQITIFESEESVEKEFLTLASMSYFVISNSTFAWWAARAGSHEKKVLYPDPWVANSNLAVPPKPEAWDAYDWVPSLN